MDDGVVHYSHGTVDISDSFVRLKWLVVVEISVLISTIKVIMLRRRLCDESDNSYVMVNTGDSDNDSNNVNLDNGNIDDNDDDDDNNDNDKIG